MHGPLSEIGLIEVLQLLARGRRSGVLAVTRADGEAPHRLQLDRGIIVSLEPDAGDDATRAALVQRHAATSADARDDRDLLGRPAARAMRNQLAVRAIGAMMHWSHGRFDFTEAPPAGGPLALSPDALVFDLVGSESRRVELAASLDAFHAVPAFAAVDRVASGTLPPLSPLDWRVLDRVDGVRDVAAIAAAIDEPLEDVAERVQSLESAAILELHARPADPASAARMALEAGRYEEAAVLLRERVTQQPRDSEAWRALGLAEVGAGRFERAIDAWQSWRAGEPGRATEALALMQAARTMVEALRDARD